MCSDDGGNRLSRRARHSTRRYSCASSRRRLSCGDASAASCRPRLAARAAREPSTRRSLQSSCRVPRAAEASHAARVAVRERLRLRGAVLSLQRAARAFSARRRLAERRAAMAEMQLGAAYREEALLDQLRHAESSSAPKVQSPDHALTEAAAPAPAPPLSKRGHSQRRRAALRLQAAARGSWARAQFARALEVRRTDEARLRQEKALVSAARQERRRERERLTAAAVRVQSTIRAHWGRLEAALRRDERDFSKLRSLAVAAQRAAPSPAAATGRQQPAPVGRQPAMARHNGSKSSAVAASPRATLPPSSSRLAVTVHSAVLSEALHRHPRVQVAWVVVEIAGGRLLSAATRRLPLPAVGEPLRFDAPPAALELRSGPLAAELVALLRSGAEADNESDVVFSLFGAKVNDPPQAALYLGEAYVNLHEQVAAGVDVDASTPLTLLGSNAQGDDVAIGSLYVTVSVVQAIGALLRRDSPSKALDERFLERDFHYDD